MGQEDVKERIINATIGLINEKNGEVTKVTATQVFETLFTNPVISGISILGDLNNPSVESNSANTMQGFMAVCGEEIPLEKRRRIAFSLVAIMQEAFLYRDISGQYLGYELSVKTQRERFITEQVEFLMRGATVSKKERK